MTIDVTLDQILRTVLSLYSCCVRVLGSVTVIRYLGGGSGAGDLTATPARPAPAGAPFADPAHWPARPPADPGPGQPRDRHGQAAAIAAPPDYEADLSPSWPEGEAAPARRGASAITLERLLSARWWPLSIILAAQIALSVRLIWRTSAFIDEALYLSVGHLELAHIFHHAPMPEVASYMSGSPVVYPPLAAIADEIGGLAGARLLSLAFILLATVLLHGVCRRLTGSRSAAFFAAALFTAIAPSQFLGAFATYDAMALALLAVAAWLGVVAADADPARRYLLIGIGGVAIMIADAAKYAATIFDPVVLAVVGLAVGRQHGRRAGQRSCRWRSAMTWPAAPLPWACPRRPCPAPPGRRRWAMWSPCRPTPPG
jgi:hypothetical protein